MKTEQEIIEKIIKLEKQVKTLDDKVPTELVKKIEIAVIIRTLRWVIQS